MSLPKSTSKVSGKPASGNQAAISDQLIEKARADGDAVLKELESQLTGLSAAEAKSRIKRYGLNEIAREKHQSPLVPANVRVLTAKDLFLNQAALTGESVPMEKKAHPASGEISNPLDLPNIGFLGTSVESETATAVVLHTGKQTYFGSLAASIVGERVLTSFDKGVNKFTWLMIRFIAVMVPAVFLINGLTKHNWLEAFIFAMAVAVGLTPEMLPMIVTVNLSNGALAMSRKKVIVKRLNAIQNFGAADVLCTDKTGTLTQGKIVLEKLSSIMVTLRRILKLKQIIIK